MVRFVQLFALACYASCSLAQLQAEAPRFGFEGDGFSFSFPIEERASYDKLIEVQVEQAFATFSDFAQWVHSKTGVTIEASIRGGLEGVSDRLELPIEIHARSQSVLQRLEVVLQNTGLRWTMMGKTLRLTSGGDPRLYFGSILTLPERVFSLLHTMVPAGDKYLIEDVPRIASRLGAAPAGVRLAGTYGELQRQFVEGAGVPLYPGDCMSSVLESQMDRELTLPRAPATWAEYLQLLVAELGLEFYYSSSAWIVSKGKAAALQQEVLERAARLRALLDQQIESRGGSVPLSMAVGWIRSRAIPVYVESGLWISSPNIHVRSGTMSVLQVLEACEEATIWDTQDGSVFILPRW